MLSILAALSPPVSAAEGIAVARVRLVDALPPSRPVDDRLAEIRRRIEEALVYPELARSRGETGDVTVRFTIGAEGGALGVEITRSSGRWLLDRAAEHGVEDAAPLPYVWGRLEVPVRFDLER